MQIIENFFRIKNLLKKIYIFIHIQFSSHEKFQIEIPGNRNGRIFSLENLLERIMIRFFFHRKGRKKEKKEKIQIPIPRLDEDEERRGWQRRARRCSRNEIIARSGCFSHWPAFIRNIAHNILPPS